MPHGQILQRAFDITRRQRALWPFGMVAVLVGTASRLIEVLVQPEATGTQASFMTSAWWRRVYGQPGPVPVLVTLAVVAWIALSLLTYSLSEGALVHMVSEVADGRAISVREGLAAGWARCPRLAAITAITFGGPGVLVCLALAPAALGVWGREMDIVSAACCIFLPLLLFVVAVLIAAPLCLPFMHRRCVLEGDDVVASIRQGIRLVRRDLGAVVVTGLLLLGVDIVASTVLAPITISATLAGSVLRGTALIATAAAYALSIGVFGLAVVVGSAVWTLAYRETKPQRAHPARGRRRRGARARA